MGVVVGSLVAAFLVAVFSLGAGSEGTSQGGHGRIEVPVRALGKRQGGLGVIRDDACTWRKSPPQDANEGISDALTPFGACRELEL